MVKIKIFLIRHKELDSICAGNDEQLRFYRRRQSPQSDGFSSVSSCLLEEPGTRSFRLKRPPATARPRERPLRLAGLQDRHDAAWTTTEPRERVKRRELKRKTRGKDSPSLSWSHVPSVHATTQPTNRASFAFCSKIIYASHLSTRPRSLNRSTSWMSDQNPDNIRVSPSE